MWRQHLTPAQEAAYLANPGHCPQCQSEDISGDFIEVEANTTFQEVTCSNCGFVWTDVYTLSRVFTDYDRERHPSSKRR